MTATQVSPARPVPRAAEESTGFGTLALAFLRGAVRIVVPMLVAGILIVVLWWAVLVAFHVDPSIGKMPTDVWAYLFDSDDAAANRKAVGEQLAVTLGDAAWGFVAGMLGSMLVAMIFVMSRSVEQAAMPVAMLLRSVPLVALTPVIVLIFGREIATTAIIGAIVVFFPSLVNIALGLRSASPQTMDLITAYGGSRWTALRKVAVPTSLPAFFASARIGVPGALTGALLAEWLATGKGVGSDILQAIGLFDYDKVWAEIAALTVTSVVLYTVVGLIESAVLAAWGPNAGKR